ncbi:TonB-dependent receptor [Aestuariicella hydrocarbonica]|uniref:TonB-dependent receptor n=1 Tax=Pseudomaricurvus hydrocarbonicus TaxID=1470433 RepID=A0A9E5JVN6_9GAMM|nr:TonB-dependent receptor [Aestuariicella hydrocarbonica]NHO66433.1 TonB-dependent receptor [Aestuariicella hydrocarbonica]
MKRSILGGAVAAVALSATAGADNFAIEEVVVTAQKRAESLQDVPIAITAFNSQMMAEAGIDGIDNVAQFTPGFAMTSYNKSTPQPYIRGIGTNTSGAGDDASVAMFIDDVYISRAGAYDSNLFDLERVEVLRGPQGTLYGKNVVGGALNITTRKPNMQEFEGRLRVDLGNYNKRDFQAYFSGPLTDSLAGKISLADAKRDGYIENTHTGNDVQDEDSQAVRAGLLWDAASNITVNWGVDASKVRESGVGRVLNGDPIFGISATSPNINDRDKTFSPHDGFTDRDVAGTSLKVDWETDYGTVTSVTGYRTSDYQFYDDLVPAVDLSGRNLSYASNYTDENEKQFSQEVRLVNPLSDSPWEWTVGLYYFHDDIDRLEQWGTEALGGGTADFDATNTTESKAVFGQLSYNLNDWRFTAGGRYTNERKDFTLDTSGYEPYFTAMYSPFSVDADKSWDNFSGKFSIDYMGIENVLIYASMSEGFKSGSFNSLAPATDVAVQALDPELARQYELGLKSQWWDDRVRFNAVAFNIDYQDLQSFLTDSSGQIIVENAGKATSQGIELELTVLPLEGLELNATYSYLDATYDEYVSGGADYSGNRLTRAPKNTYTLSGSYTFAIGESGDLSLRLDYLNQGDIFRTADNDDNSKIDGYGLLNARVGFTSYDGSWEVALWGKNLTDKEYAVFRNDFSVLNSFYSNDGVTTSDILGAPRTYGLTLTYNM